MSIIERAKAVIKKVTSDPNGFGKEIVFVAPGGETATVFGLHTKHHLGIDTDGAPVYTKNAHISVSEELLTDADYPVRVSGEVSLKGHKVTVKDSTETEITYVIRECFPNETVGFLTCILGAYK